MVRLVVAALFVLFTSLLSRAAFANASAPYHRDPNAAGGAFTVGQTSLVVEHETLTIDCTGGRNEHTIPRVRDAR